MKNILREIRNLPDNIKNIVGWIKILWNNFDWDHSFFLEILEYKMTKIKHYFEQDTIVCDGEAKEIIEQLTICINACNHLRLEDYEAELWEEHYNKYPFSFTNINGRSKEECESFDKTQKIVKLKNKELRNQLFDTMKDNFDYWWD